MNIPWPRGAGCGISASGWTGSATKHGGHAGHQCFINLLRTNKVDMRINTTGSKNMALTGKYFSPRANNNINITLSIWITRLTYGKDTTIFDAHISFNDAPVIDDNRIGND